MFKDRDWNKHGIAIVCGEVSGNLEVIDMDNKIPNFIEQANSYFDNREVRRLF